MPTASLPANAQTLSIWLHPYIAGKKSERVPCFDDTLRELVKRMYATMYAANGVGLAAAQVGCFQRIAVVNVEDTVLTLVNPRIIAEEGTQELLEGCLSIPGKSFYAKVLRPMKVVCEYQDEFGKEQSVACVGNVTRAICHEVDHMDGKFYIDHLEPFHRRFLIEKIKKKIHKVERERARREAEDRREARAAHKAQKVERGTEMVGPARRVVDAGE